MNLNLRQCRVLPLEEAAGTGGWGGHREPAPQGPSPPEGRWPSVGGQLAWGSPCGPLRSDLPLALGVSALPTRCGKWPAGWGHAGKRPLAALRDLAWPGCPHAPGSGLVCEPGTDAGLSPSIPSRVGGSPTPVQRRAPSCPLATCPSAPGKGHSAPAPQDGPAPGPSAASCRVSVLGCHPPVSCCSGCAPVAPVTTQTVPPASSSRLGLQGQVQGDHVSVTGCGSEAWPSRCAGAWPSSAQRLHRAAPALAPAPRVWWPWKGLGITLSHVAPEGSGQPCALHMSPRAWLLLSRLPPHLPAPPPLQPRLTPPVPRDRPPPSQSPHGPRSGGPRRWHCAQCLEARAGMSAAARTSRHSSAAHCGP